MHKGKKINCFESELFWVQPFGLIFTDEEQNKSLACDIFATRASLVCDISHHTTGC